MALRSQKRRDQIERWEERVQVTEILKKTPKPPLLVNKSVFSDAIYGELVREKRLELAQQARKKAAMMASRNDDEDGINQSGGAGGGLGGAGLDGCGMGGEMRGEDIRNFQKQWLVMASLVAFIKLRELARQHAALRKLKDLLTPKIHALYARKRRIAREKTVLGLFGDTMHPITVATMRTMPLFRDLDDGHLESIAPQWTACCNIDEFIIDERESDADLFVLDQGVVEITKRRVPTLDVLAQMMASKSYVAAHGAVWMNNLGGSNHHNNNNDPKEIESPTTTTTEAREGIVSPLLPTAKEEEGSSSSNKPTANDTSAGPFNESGAVVTLTPPPRGEDAAASPFLSRLVKRHRGSVTGLPNVMVIPKKKPKTLSEALRENYDVIGTITERGTALGLLSMLEGASTFVGFRAGHGKRCMLWRLPRRVIMEVFHKRPRSLYVELLRELRLGQLRVALPPTPQSLRNCDINIVFRHWTDAALAELITALRPVCFMEGETIWDSATTGGSVAALAPTSGATTASTKPPIVFLARGVGALTSSTTHALAALYNPRAQTSKNLAAAGSNAKGQHQKKVVAPRQPLAGSGTANGAFSRPHGGGRADLQASVNPGDGLQQLQQPPRAVAAIGGNASDRAPEVADLFTIETKCVVGPWQSVGDTLALVTERRSSSLVAMSCVDAWMCTREAMTSIIQGHPALLLTAIQSIRDLRAAQVAERGTGMLREFLGTDPLLKLAPERFIDDLVAHATPFWLPPHEYLCGKDPLLLPALMVVLDGTAYAQRTTGAGSGAAPSGGGGSSVGSGSSVTDAHDSDIFSAQLGPGCILNTAAMLLGQPWVHSYNIRSRTVVEGFEITTEQLTRSAERTFGPRKGDQAKALLAKLREAASAVSGTTSYVPFVFGSVPQDVLNAAASALQR